MRLTLLLIFFALCIAASAQKRKVKSPPPPASFQILFAENVLNTRGDTVKSLQVFSADDTLFVRQGFLSMVHDSVFPFEFSGDTTIILWHLHSALMNSKIITDRKPLSSSNRPGLNYLFIEQMAAAKKARLSATGACHDCGSGIDIIYPPIFAPLEIPVENNVCLVWDKTTRDEKYELKFQNIYGDQLASIASDTNTFTLDSAMIDTLFRTEDKIVFQITGMSTPEQSTLCILRKRKNDFFKYPFSCRPINATAALVGAFYIETSAGDYPKEAEKYYLLAMSLSRKAFFRQMFDNFKKRSEAPMYYYDK